MANEKPKKSRDKAPEPARKTPRWLFPALCLSLALITAFAFSGAAGAGFIDMDDPRFVTANSRVQAGITWDNIKWAFSTTYFGFYFPLTWMSHMLDCQLFGLNASGHHITSLIIHILNSLLLFASLRRMTGALWRSAAVSALFALHPLHVESVLWIAERKDVLCAFFWFLCLLAYSWYVEKPSAERYSLVFFSFLFGLLSKTMIITLPFLLLLLDFWPLGRLDRNPGGSSGKLGTGRPGSIKSLLYEKIPLFVLVPVFAYLTVAAQKQAKTFASLDALSFAQRTANAAISYAAYLQKAFIPVGLAFYYPYPKEGVSMTAGAACVVLLAAITVIALFFGMKRRYLFTGWFWYVGTLVPVIGLVQVGAQSMADRYTYVPLVGVFIALSWSVTEIAGKKILARRSLAAVAAGLLVVLMILTRVQVGHWVNSEKLFYRALAVTKDNAVIESNMGLTLYSAGRTDEALAHYGEALRIDPSNAPAHINMGNALAAKGLNTEAISHYEEALRTMPESKEAMNNLGLALMKENRNGEAILRFEECVRAYPRYFDARLNLGVAFTNAGDLKAAEAQYMEAIRLDPDSAQAFNNLGVILTREGKAEDAADNFRAALRVSPGFEEARKNLEAVEKYLKEQK